MDATDDPEYSRRAQCGPERLKRRRTRKPRNLGSPRAEVVLFLDSTAGRGDRYAPAANPLLSSTCFPIPFSENRLIRCPDCFSPVSPDHFAIGACISCQNQNNG